jgi:hypothetical protein
MWVSDLASSSNTLAPHPFSQTEQHATALSKNKRQKIAIHTLKKQNKNFSQQKFVDLKTVLFICTNK